MGWLFRTLNSSIGKKVQMALSGLLLCGFLVTHLAGNLFLYGGREMFNHYAKALEENPLLPAAEIGLLLLFLLHIATALRVTYGNKRARPVAYAKTACAGGKTIGSATMVFSGLLLLAFLIVHVKTFRFAPDRSDLYAMVMAAFQNKLYAGFYVAAMAALGLHLSHGFWSGFQTLGADHPKYTPWIKRLGLAFAAAVAFGFASIPIWASLR
ncbi:MAG: succinate dehydrogenase cytochrome b subunit [Elusimicrobia bacterium]|nr:succinate dehydrogenase cytochrome b subunit [Elusimicrobiota bacterium]